ncbi:MAG: LD-carboxypeptidase [Betaproteobacteria bacterium]|nr:LD-carboxypeptidase [Betaproteobacteria bacterium]
MNDRLPAAPARRRFGAGAAALLAAASLPSHAWSAMSGPLVKPARLRRGDLVGLIAPGGAMEDAHIEKSVRNIESLGMRVKLGDNVRLRRGNYSGFPLQQVEDLHAMFRDAQVKAIWTGRGGSGGSAMLPLIDYALIRAHPRIVVGFSDATALHLAILRRAGLVTFHGPVAISSWTDYSREHLVAAIMEPRPTWTIESAAQNRRKAESQPEFAERVIRPGVAAGPLVGGNLAVLTALVGTPYAAQMRGRVVFLEEINEAPYRINRMLTQLVQSGDLKEAAAVMLGTFIKCVPPPGEASLTLEETLVDLVEPLGVPSAYGFSFGHIAHQFTIPMGIRARVDATERTLTLLEPGVY